MTGIRDRYDSDCPALYGRHPDHSEVLKLAWKREDQPVPIESIDWAAVHAGELVPPSRVVVPEVDADGDPRSRMGSSGLMIVCRSGKTEFFRRTVYSMSYEAANYTHDGHLISHRAKGGGWEQVTPQRGGDSRERQDPINLDVIAGGGGGGNGINTSGEISGPKAAGSCAERADASSKSPETGKPKGSDTGERPALPPTNDHRTSGDIIGEEGPFPTVPTMDDYIRRQKEAELAYCKTGVHPEWYQDWLATKVWKYQTPEPKP
ncbi:MAG: hypothetical protein GY926_19530 [bacterium]|nr:hypothetical protein [bacterium]